MVESIGGAPAARVVLTPETLVRPPKGELGLTKVPLGALGAPGDPPGVGGSLPAAMDRPQPATPRTVPPNAFPDAAIRLSEFAAAPTSIQQIAQIVQDQGLASREAARQDRQIARDADMQAQQAAANKVRDQAVFAFAASIVTSTIAIAGSAMSLYGAAKAAAAKPASDPASAVVKPTAESLTSEAKTSLETAKASPNSSVAANERLNARLKLSEAEDVRRASDVKDGQSRSVIDQGRRLADTWAARGQITGEVGKIAGAGLNFGAAQKDAERLEEQARSSKARTAAEDQTDFIRAYTDNVQAVIAKLSAIQESQADSMRQIIRA